MRLLIIKLGSIGDIIHTLPSLAAIRRALPDTEISWVVEKRSAEIIRGNLLIDNIIEVDTKGLRRGMRIDEILLNAGRQIKGLRQFKFDLAVDFQGLLKSAVIGKLSGAKRRWGFSRKGLREPPSRILLTDTVETVSRIHVIRKNLALAEGSLKIDVPDDKFEFPITTYAEHRDEADRIISAVAN
ncbi:MAG: glycosyltransferase family 9 protein, partial [Pyrinomonadaceae bacterium]